MTAKKNSKKARTPKTATPGKTANAMNAYIAITVELAKEHEQ